MLRNLVDGVLYCEAPCNKCSSATMIPPCDAVLYLPGSPVSTLPESKRQNSRIFSTTIFGILITSKIKLLLIPNPVIVLFLPSGPRAWL